MFREAVESGTFVATCEFVPGRGMGGPSLDAPLSFARDIVALGLPVHAVSLTDNPGGNPAVSPDIIAGEIQAAGVDALVHFSCRDRNRNALESRAMSLARAGINNVLVLTGDFTEGGYRGNAEPVFDLDCVQALRYLSEMNAGLEVPGRKKGVSEHLPPTHFFLGAAVSPFKFTEEELMPQFFKLEKKVASGAGFIVTQLGYDMRKFYEVKRYLASRNIQVPVLGNVYVLSAGAARAMNSGAVPGCVVTDELRDVLQEEATASDKGKAQRLERAAKMTAMFKGMGFSGVHIGGFGLKADDFRFVLERAVELESRWQEFTPEVAFGREGEFYAFPPPTDYAPDASETDPLTRVTPAHKPLAYRIGKLAHRSLFQRRSVGHRLMCAYYRAVGNRPLFSKASHFLEYLFKFSAYGCRDCGDCALLDAAYCCLQSSCAKQQRNGPCGGSVNGMCEHYPKEKACAWTRVYGRLKADGELERMRTQYIPPRKTELAHTSGWANYCLRKDHSATNDEDEGPTQ